MNHFEFRRTVDYDRVAGVLRHPKIFPHISDDLSGDPAAFQPPVDAAYIEVHEAGAFLGLWILEQQNAICWEIHTCLLPEAWGRAAAAAIEMREWIFRNTPCERIVTTIAVTNRLAIRLAKAGGMVEYGTNPRSVRRGGKLVDQVLLGVSKE